MKSGHKAMKSGRKATVLAIAIAVIYHHQCFMASNLRAPEEVKDSVKAEDGARRGCKTLGLPRAMADIPLSPRAYTADRGVTFNFLIIRMNKDIEPPIHLAMPNHDWVTKRINQNTGRMNVWNNGNIWKRATESKPEDGVFIDIGGWIGDTAIPSAAMGINTYVFEPVRNNTNMMHFAVAANGCHVAEHLTIVNALVGDEDRARASVYVTERADNAAASPAQATQNIGAHAGDFEQPTEMVALDSFFPPGTRVQNLKIDVQGFEWQVLQGARRILEENRDRLHLRFEHDEGLIKAAGNDPREQLEFLKMLGYSVVSKSGQDIDMRAIPTK